MRRASFALGLLLAFAAPSFAQGPSQLELVRALRSSGMVDLAIQRLEELKNKPGLLTADEAKLIPLEMARIRLEEASRETEDARRASLIGQARISFKEFITANPTHPMAAQANVELARLSSLQAKGLLSKANRIENPEAKALEFSRARPDFNNAINLYLSAILNLENRLKGLDEKDPLSAELKRSKAQAELDAGVLRYELALTHIGDDGRKERSEEIAKAQKEFDKIVNRYQATRVGYLGTIWSWQCAFENGESVKAVPEIEKFVAANRNNREAADAIRLAGFFGIQHTFEAENVKETGPAAKFIRTEQAAQRWLQMYPDAKNTSEGLGARYRRALMKELQARLPGGVIYTEIKAKTPAKSEPKPKSKDPKDKEPAKEAPPAVFKVTGITPAARQLLEDANKIYKDLTDTDNEYSERAQRRRLMNQLVVLEADGKGDDPPMKAINTLEQAYLAAQVQQARIFELNKDTTKTEVQKDAEEKRRIELAVNFLERGLQRVAPKDTPKDVFDAQMLLVQFLSRKDRAIEAAVLGEGLARNNPKMPRASVAAALAVFAYNSSLAKLKESPTKTDEAEEADKRRIIELATFADKTWPNDGPTDAIRHVLAFYLGKQQDHDTAWKTYAKIGSGYSEVYQARREMAGAVFYLIRSEEKDPKKNRDQVAENIAKRKQELDATIAMLDALPEPAPSSPAGTIDSWAGAKTMQAQLFYMKSDYDKVDAVVKVVVDGLKKFPTTGPGAIDPKKKDDLGYVIRSLRYNSLQGRAVEFMKLKEFAKVGETLGTELDALKKEFQAAAPAEATPGFDRMRGAQRNFLIACMSAYVQNKQADQASELLDALQSSGGSLESNLASMRQLNNTISGQIAGLTKEGKKAEAEEVAKSFTDFLDKIKGEDTAKLPNGVVLFLGQGYAAVNQNARSAELFGQLAAKPFVPDPKKGQQENDDAEAKHKVFVRQLEFLQARSHRQAGVQGGGKPEYDKAMALMTKIVGDPLKKGTRGWGYGNPDVRKEYIALLEDQLMFGPAGNNWKQLLREFAPPGTSPPVPIKFLGNRPAFVAFGQAADEALLGVFLTPGSVSAFVDIGFKNVYPPAAERRNQQRLQYFDLFFETQRCSARAYTEPAIVAKVKGGQEKANQSLANVGQQLFELLSNNTDVPPEVKEKIQDFLNDARYKECKKKFDELAAGAPKATQ
jgi:hypothetical protein